MLTNIYDIRSVPYTKWKYLPWLSGSSEAYPVLPMGKNTYIEDRLQANELENYSASLCNDSTNHKTTKNSLQQKKKKALLYDSSVRTHNTSSREPFCISFYNFLKFSVITTKYMFQTQNTDNILKNKKGRRKCMFSGSLTLLFSFYLLFHFICQKKAGRY